jgi:hypothetical protein
MAMYDRGKWASGQELFNRFARMDRQVAMHLADLSKQEANETKLEDAIESGRVYGMRQQRYEMLLKRQLNREWRRPPVQPMW